MDLRSWVDHYTQSATKLRTYDPAQLDPVVSEDQVYASYAGAGSVAYTYPGTGAAVYPGQRVVIYVSAGAAPAQPEPGPEQPTDGGGTTLGPDAGNNGNGNGNGNPGGVGLPPE